MVGFHVWKRLNPPSGVLADLTVTDPSSSLPKMAVASFEEFVYLE